LAAAASASAECHGLHLLLEVPPFIPGAAAAATSPALHLVCKRQPLGTLGRTLPSWPLLLLLLLLLLLFVCCTWPVLVLLLVAC
jgi:hypothetical protein